MPVSFAVAAHPAKPYTFPDGRFGYTADDALAKACRNQHTKVSELLQLFADPIPTPDLLTFRFPRPEYVKLSLNPRNLFPLLLQSFYKCVVFGLGGIFP
jgi:hypothetical protein